MKKILFVMMAMTVMFMTAADAQNRRAGGQQQKKEMTAEQLAGRRADRMAEQLSLTSEQRTQLYNLFLQSSRENVKHRQQMQQLHDNHAATMKTARENEKAQMKKILTPEQYSRWEQMQADRPGKCGDCKKDASKKGCGCQKAGNSCQKAGNRKK